MKITSIIAAITLVVSSLLMGCSVSVNETNEIDLGSHRVTITPRSSQTTTSSMTSGANKVYSFRSGDTQVTIRNEVLIVDDFSYGPLAEGDAISIDNGIVSVGGVNREGTPL